MSSEEELFRQAGEPPAAAPPPAVDDGRLIPEREDQRALSEGVEALHRRPLTSVPTVKPPGVGEPAKPPGGDLERIPLPAYLEERERRQRLERELEELRREKGGQQQQPGYDPENIFTDPQGYQARVQAQIDQRAAMAELNFDLRLAELQYGDEWKEAWDSYIKHVGETDERTGKGKHPLDYQRVMNAASPGQEIMSWHRERKYREEVGNDPQAYRERVRQELLAEMNGEPPARAAQPEQDDRPRAADGRFQTTRRLPTSLSKAPGGSAAHGDETSLDGSDASLWKATASRQRPRRQ